MKCEGCDAELTEKQVRRYERKYGKRRWHKPPPVCSPECHRGVTSAPPKHERQEDWARAEHGTEGRRWGSQP